MHRLGTGAEGENTATKKIKAILECYTPSLYADKGERLNKSA
jgi:hypothetical protein